MTMAPPQSDDAFQFKLTDTESTLSDFQKRLRIYIRASYPLLYLVTAEEERAIELIGEALAVDDKIQRQVYVWSVSRGLCTTSMKVVHSKTTDPNQILPFLLEFDQPGVFILEDFHFFLDERLPTAALVIRQMRDLITPFKSARKSIILLSSVLKIPPELERDLTVIDLDMPSEAELATTLDRTSEQVKENPRVKINMENGGREKIVKALAGLTRAEAENALAKIVVTRSRIDPEDIKLLLAEKEQIIRKSGMLEFYSSPECFGSIGGLDNLKQWLRQRGKAFSEKARLFGLPSPRGLLLVGVPGCGKSLSVKAIAAEWQMPLLKFDLGRVFGGIVGQSEGNMRRALKMAEAVAPCILWIDEIEKGLAGAQSGNHDSGTSQRVFGTLLSWMEENQKQVFTVATANDVQGLPPELLRKGRFDEIFFIDLPNTQERANILAIHLTRQNRDYRDFDLPMHVQATEGFCGAELEQVIISGLYEAYAEGDDAVLSDCHLQSAITDTVPLSRSRANQIARLREEAIEKWRWASSDHNTDNSKVREADISEPLAMLKKRNRVFDV